MTKEIITVIGSTGNIGHELINILSTAGKSVRAVLRNFSQARPLPGVTWLQTDVSDESVLDSTLAGTDKLFILTGNNPGFGQTQINVIRAAERLGVKHIVKLSALGASSRTQSPITFGIRTLANGAGTTRIQHVLDYPQTTRLYAKLAWRSCTDRKSRKRYLCCHRRW